MHNPWINTKRQTGAVLLISMIMLLLLSLIGATGMQVTTLEEKMAGNTRDSNLAFQNAETTLRGVEKSLSSGTPPAFNNTNGYYIYDATKELWETIDWSSDTDTKVFNLTLGGVSPISPRYIVEELPPVPSAGDSLEAATAQTSKYFRVTTHAYGVTDSSVVLLQSVYKR